MAQNQKSSNSEGVFKKIYKKLSFSTINSHQNPPDQTIPSEFDRPAASVSSCKKKSVTFFLPKSSSNRNEQRSTNKPCPDAAKAASRQDHVSSGGRVGNNNAVREAKPSAAKTKSLKDDGKFSDYIRKVKDKMRTVSNVGAAKTATTRRDSFDDKVCHYINRTKIKMRTTTNVGIGEDVSFK